MSTSGSHDRPRTIYLLNQVNQAVRTDLDLRLKVHDLTGLQYTIMTVIRGQDGISSAELARRFFVSPQTMNEVVAGLERRGLIARTPLEANRRILVASLTEEGLELTGSCDRIADEVDADAFADMSQEDRSALRRILRDRIEAQRARTKAGPG